MPLFRTSRHHLRRPVLAALLVAVCVVAQVWAGVHAVAVRHERCAEHGEAVHAGDHHAGEQVEREAVALDAAAGWRDGEPAAEDEHEHCCAMATRRHTVAALDVAGVIAPAPVDVAITPPATEAVVDARALYRLAPKVSPPAPV